MILDDTLCAALRRAKIGLYGRISGEEETALGIAKMGVFGHVSLSGESIYTR